MTKQLHLTTVVIYDIFCTPAVDGIAAFKYTGIVYEKQSPSYASCKRGCTWKNGYILTLIRKGFYYLMVRNK